MDDVKEIESWLDCWLGSVDVLIRYAGKASHSELCQLWCETYTFIVLGSIP
jgi:hypothetical protein